MEKAKVIVYNIIRDDDDNSTAADIFDGVIITLIIANVLLVILDTFTMPVWFGRVADVIETVSVILFTVEYAARIWTAPLKYPKSTPARARLKFAFTFLALVDLVSILPFYIPVLVPGGFRVLRLLRVIRLLRLFKVGRYTHALEIIKDVFTRKASQLASAMLTVFILLVISSVLMYSLEHKAQPEVFKNASDGLWWSLASITSANYGDIYPITIGGEIFSSIVALLGVGLIAVPTGIISAGFVEVVAEENPAEAPPVDTTIPDEIRQYKALLDEGAITAGEYEEKKKQLLSL